MFQTQFARGVFSAGLMNRVASACVAALWFCATGSASAQQGGFIPLILKNDCILEMPASPSVKSMTMSVQDYYPFTCPPSGRYTGNVSIGIGWTLAPKDSAEEEFIGVRMGMVREGRFEGVHMSQNQRGVLFLNWQTATGESFSKRFDRNAKDYSEQAVQQAMADAVAASPSSDRAKNLDYLRSMFIYWNDDPAGEMQRFTKNTHTKAFMNPGWVGASTSGEPKPRLVDDPKTVGRGARGG